MPRQQNQAEDNARDIPSPLRTGVALYVHWPFCKKKCPYCDFNSHVREGVDHAAWQAALLRELGYWHARMPDKTITSIFFGGGTPSLMAPATAGAIIAAADRLWGLAAECEITLEANPTSVEADNFAALAAAGVNRLSLGVQSFRPESLAFLGREHSVREAHHAIALAAANFARYSFDLIYALPGQTVEAWEAELREALSYARGHLSLYQLTIEENTAFHHAYHVGKSFTLPEDSLAAALYTRTQSLMEAAGMPAYEISNHAAAGQESRHNLAYWQGDSYVGIGPGAHGRVDIGDARHATRAIKSPERWLEQTLRIGHGVEEDLTLTTAERAEEALLMGLRLPRQGVDLSRLRPDVAHYLTTLWADGRAAHLVAQGLLLSSSEGAARLTHLRPTARGQLLLNHVIEHLLG
ncbi:MAG: radical SAM family heme chaperone HemW [Alphaproteobacteria bacterium]|nr:radical SAM family heme chaperone HemW [Alphaproteobacteria bacterium]